VSRLRNVMRGLALTVRELERVGRRGYVRRVSRDIVSLEVELEVDDALKRLGEVSDVVSMLTLDIEELSQRLGALRVAREYVDGAGSAPLRAELIDEMAQTLRGSP
jgi:hypothetical protein